VSRESSGATASARLSAEERPLPKLQVATNTPVDTGVPGQPRSSFAGAIGEVLGRYRGECVEMVVEMVMVCAGNAGAGCRRQTAVRADRGNGDAEPARFRAVAGPAFRDGRRGCWSIFFTRGRGRVVELCSDVVMGRRCGDAGSPRRRGGPESVPLPSGPLVGGSSTTRCRGVSRLPTFHRVVVAWTASGWSRGR